MAEFRHYILTRFNAGLYRRAAELRICPQEWMEHRLRLFTALTLPSIMGQSCQDFAWHVLMDKQTPEPDIRRLESIGYANMRLIYPTPGKPSWLQGIPSGDYDLITSRIDNDDAFHRDTVQTIQETWRAQREHHSKPWLIVFPFGLIMDLAARQAWLMEYWSNNSPTLVEAAQSPRTICQWDHSRIPADVQKCCVKDKPYWLQVVHSQNLRNVVESDNPDRIVRKDLPAKPEHLVQFGIDIDRLPTG
jgi:hypothetical protein